MLLITHNAQKIAYKTPQSLPENTKKNHPQRGLEKSIGSMSKSKSFLLFGTVLALLVSSSTAATMEEEEKECADQLGNLAACIPFVSGAAKKPTPECCQDAKKVKDDKPKCLCVLIKESSDPSMGLPVNTTLALQMPSACNIHAKVSDCPTLLKMPLNSPEARIFHGGDGDVTSSSSTKEVPGSSSSGTKTDSTPEGNDAGKLNTDSNMNLLSMVTVLLMACIFF